MKALITIDHGEEGLDAARIEALISHVACSLGLPAQSEVSITFVDDAEMARLNEGYRGKEGPTDVLSFECDNLDDCFPEDGQTFEAGDIIIAPDVAVGQAKDLGHSLTEEVDTLIVHGMLHLMGYDHVEDDEAALMQEEQDALLASWWASQEGARDGMR